VTRKQTKEGVFARTLRTPNHRSWSDRTSSSSTPSKQQFLEVFTRLTAELVADEKEDGQVQIALDWISKMMEYNVPHGKLNRGLAVVDGMRALAGSDGKVEDTKMFKAQVVGWCIEWLQAAFLIWDDIMDESVTRRGQPCWYKNGDVLMNAINDGLVLECQIYSMLKKHLKTEPCYADLLELFHDVTSQTAHGQVRVVFTLTVYSYTRSARR
jgi:farnesyl diphosphate synthase